MKPSHTTPHRSANVRSFSHIPVVSSRLTIVCACSVSIVSCHVRGLRCASSLHSIVGVAQRKRDHTTSCHTAQRRRDETIACARAHRRRAPLCNMRRHDNTMPHHSTPTMHCRDETIPLRPLHTVIILRSAAL